jgi:Protein of unknown function (DUF2865)
MQFARSAFCSALLLLGFSGAAISLRIDNRGELAAASAPPDAPQVPRISGKNTKPAQERIANGDWADRLRSEDFWQHMRSPQSRPETGARRSPSSARSETPHKSWGFRSEEGRSRNARDGGSYRTVCVRLCDGYFWPVSFAAARTSLAQDRRKCEQSCESPAKLYVSKDAESPLEDMRDENGRFYRDLKTAFVYRSSYLESCKCRAHPWEAEAKARHAGYVQNAKPSLRQR